MPDQRQLHRQAPRFGGFSGLPAGNSVVVGPSLVGQYEALSRSHSREERPAQRTALVSCGRSAGSGLPWCGTLAVVLTAMELGACHSGSAVVATPDGGPPDAQAATGGAGGAPDAGAPDLPEVVSLALPGPCVEGMECNGNDPGGSAEFRCVCQGGSWTCPMHDAQGWLTSDLPLPTVDPQPGTACNGANYACTLPDHCGSLCLCNEAGQWVCKTVLSDATGGPSVTDGVPDAGVPASAAAGCAWPPCGEGAAAPPDGTQCFTPVCFSTIFPSGATFFPPGGSGCSVEH